MRKKINKNLLLSVLFLFPFSMICKFFQYRLLDDNFFNDANYILLLMTENLNIEPKGTAFYNTAFLFKNLNIFGFTSLKSWSYLLSIIFTLVCIILIIRNYKKICFKNYLFLLASIALLNIYVFNISKDIIQFVLFLIMYFFVVDEKKSNGFKILSISVLLILESIFFRPYYILVLFAFVLSLYFLKKTNKKNVWKRIFVIIFVFLFSIFMSKYIFPDAYNKVVNVRDNLTLTLSANTEIVNLFSNDNFVLFSLNYVLNTIRILFPLELTLKGIYYFPFVIYQLFISYHLLKNLKNIKKSSDTKKIILALIIGYLLTSTLYEPDFGSVIRHECTLMFFYLFMIDDDKEKILGGKNNE